MEPTPLPASLRTALIVAAAMLALVGVGGIATGLGDGDTGDLSAGGSDRTTTTAHTTETTLGPGEPAEGDAATPTTRSAGPATTRPAGGGGPTTTVATVATNACDGPPATSTNPGPLGPIPTGNYSYVSCTDPAQSQDFTVRAADEGGKVRRLRTATRQGLQLTEHLAFGSDGVTQEVLEIFAFGQSIRCDWNPDVLQYPADLSVGREWTGKSACTTQYGRFSVEGTGKVTGRRVVTIGGTQVPTWVIDSHVKFSSPQGGFEEQGVSYFDPSRSLDLYVKGTVKDEQGNSRSEALRLASLTPRPA